MSTTILFTIISLSAIGSIAAIILYFVAQKFKVYEDPRIDQVEEILPAANCGGCGYPGCRGFAEAMVKAEDLSPFYCPVGGNETMAQAAEILGKAVEEKDPLVAVIRCSGSPAHRERVNSYDGASSCTISSSLYSGETGCQFGCLGLGDCVDVCDFDAIYMDKETGLPVVVDDNCTACGACVKACPNIIIELRKKNKKDRKIFVSCVNQDKGGIAKKACSVACIGCKACIKECAYDAITVENFLAYIDPNKCKLCRKCVSVCPTDAILEINFPPRKEKPVQQEKVEETQEVTQAKKSAQPAEEKKSITIKIRRDKVLKTFPKGGVHPEEGKYSANSAIEALPLPKTVSIPISQHIGAPSKAIVAKGDKVKVGDKIAESTGFVSANIHSSVSGTVVKVDKVLDSSGYKQTCVVIDVEGDEWNDGIDRTTDLKKEISLSDKEIINKINESGIVGLGGATFPSHVKLSVPDGKKIDVLVINGVECEPYLTSDHRLMLEKAEEMLVGIQILMKALSVNRALIGIENNKPDAISHLEGLVKDYPGIEVHALKVQYPQGGEKQLIKALINREVPSGGLPLDVGSVVHNVGTAFAVYEAVQKNKPLFERVVTLTGKSVSKPSNFLVRIGTPVNELIEAAGGLPEDTGKVINGGPMMGKAINSIEIPVVKGTSGILIMPVELSKRKKESDCIRCAKCVSVCPQGLEPYLLNKLAQLERNDKLETEGVMDCIECGSCSYTCPAGLALLDYMRLGKSRVSKIIRSRKQ